MVRERRNVFGEASEQYQRARPNFPDALVNDVLAYAGDVTGVLDVGAGTGKATLAFAARDLAITCIEPDGRMAELLERECASFPKVSIKRTRFEEWRSPELFDLVYAAQSWHWIDELARWRLAHDALRRGGTLALFWNKSGALNETLRGELLALERHFGVDASGTTPHDTSLLELGSDVDVEKVGPYVDLRDDERFGNLEVQRYWRSITYSTTRYVDLLVSHWQYRMLQGAARGTPRRDCTRPRRQRRHHHSSVGD